ncbi:MAG: hypothetical protein IJY28_08580 [Clostridia bacterium]|nr:hypothetical protein [Clostridia bacterium]
MEIYIRVKALGKRKDLLAPVPYTIPDEVSSLRQLLTVLATQEAERYNRKETDAQLMPFLTAQEIDAQARTGKVGFGRIFSDKKVDVRQAVDNALQCWTDGLVRVFMNDDELTEPDAPLVIPDGAVFTLIRLTFLAGRMW